MGVRRYTEARAASNKKWNDDNTDLVAVRLPKGTKEKIQRAAETNGYPSMNAFLRDLIMDHL